MKNVKLTKKMKRLLSTGLTLVTLGQTPVASTALATTLDMYAYQNVQMDYVYEYTVVKIKNGQRVGDYTAESLNEARNSIVNDNELIVDEYMEDYIQDCFVGSEHLGMDENYAREYAAENGYSSVLVQTTYTYIVTVKDEKEDSRDHSRDRDKGYTDDELDITYDSSLDGCVAYVSIENLNLRKGCTTNTPVLKVYPYNSKVTLTGRECDRMLEVVTYDGLTGWMGQKYLSIGSKENQTTKKPTVAPVPTTSPSEKLDLSDEFYSCVKNGFSDDCTYRKMILAFAERFPDVEFRQYTRYNVYDEATGKYMEYNGQGLWLLEELDVDNLSFLETGNKYISSVSVVPNIVIEVGYGEIQDPFIDFSKIRSENQYRYELRSIDYNLNQTLGITRDDISYVAFVRISDVYVSMLENTNINTFTSADIQSGMSNYDLYLGENLVDSVGYSDENYFYETYRFVLGDNTPVLDKTIWYVAKSDSIYDFTSEIEAINWANENQADYIERRNYYRCDLSVKIETSATTAIDIYVNGNYYTSIELEDTNNYISAVQTILSENGYINYDITELDNPDTIYRYKIDNLEYEYIASLDDVTDEFVKENVLELFFSGCEIKTLPVKQTLYRIYATPSKEKDREEDSEEVIVAERPVPKQPEITENENTEEAFETFIEETNKEDKYTKYEGFKSVLDEYLVNGSNSYVIDYNNYFESDTDRIFLQHFLEKINNLIFAYNNSNSDKINTILSSIIEDYTYVVMEGYSIGIKINGEQIAVNYQDLSNEAKAYLDTIIVKAIKLRGGLSPFDTYGNYSGDDIISYINNSYYDTIDNFYSGRQITR